MHSAISRHNLKPGDRIVEPKSSLRLVQHHSIYLGQDISGTDWIIENKIGFGVRLVTAKEYFSAVIEVTRIERFYGTGEQRKAAVQKALSEIGKPYDLINYNCESFANYIQYGHTRSVQLEGGLAVLLLFLIIVIIMRA